MNILICDDANDAALALKKIIAFSVSDVNITVFNRGEDVFEYIIAAKGLICAFLIYSCRGWTVFYLRRGCA
jgi:hypothetical protein